MSGISSRNYSWYELHRTNNSEKGIGGGGIAIAVLNDLDPSWISEGDDEVEALTVEIWIEGFPVRLVCGYGPQENDNKNRKESFWKYLNQEAQNSQSDGTGFILQMDGNLWAGNTIIKSDPKKQNQNGKYFENFLLKNPHLTVVNALSICEGNITRVRHTVERREETIIDFFVVCDQILPLVEKMIIDENGQMAITRYKDRIVNSDHRTLLLEVDLTFHKEPKHDRIQVFNVRNKVCQKSFLEFTSQKTLFQIVLNLMKM